MKMERMCSECEGPFEIEPQEAMERDKLAKMGDVRYVCPDCAGLFTSPENVIKDERKDIKKGGFPMNTQRVCITADTSAYISVMEEIKNRTLVLAALINKEINMLYNVTQAESMALQIRMIIESIALASLSANKSMFDAESKKFKKSWQAYRIFKDIEGKNPDFYPKPVREIPSNTPGIKNDLLDIEEGFMTRDEIIKVHSECGNFLHAKNPYAPQRDYDRFTAQIPNWLDRIKKLLNSHKITLLNDEGFYLVHMREDTRGGQAHMYYFEPAPPHINRQNRQAAYEPNIPT